MATNASAAVPPAVSSPWLRMIRHLWAPRSATSRALSSVVRDALEVVIADVAVEPHRPGERQEPAIARGNGLARHRVRVQHACRSWRAMWIALWMTKPAGFTLYGVSSSIFAVHVDLDQARRGDLLEEHAVRIDEELVLGAGNAQRNVIVDEVVPAMRATSR